MAQLEILNYFYSKSLEGDKFYSVAEVAEEFNHLHERGIRRCIKALFLSDYLILNGADYLKSLHKGSRIALKYKLNSNVKNKVKSLFTEEITKNDRNFLAKDEYTVRSSGHSGVSHGK